MKYLGTIQSEFLKAAAGWEDLSRKTQQAYLREHPKSKRRLMPKQVFGQNVSDSPEITHALNAATEASSWATQLHGAMNKGLETPEYVAKAYKTTARAYRHAGIIARAFGNTEVAVDCRKRAEMEDREAERVLSSGKVVQKFQEEYKSGDKIYLKDVKDPVDVVAYSKDNPMVHTSKGIFDKNQIDHERSKPKKNLEGP